MLKQKKGQFFIIGGFIVISLLIFIYSLETQNSYISSFGETSILNNIMDETCMVAKNSNGSNIDSRFILFNSSLISYCGNLSMSCDLNISKDTAAPSNLTLLNYSFYNFSLVYEFGHYIFEGRFNC